MNGRSFGYTSLDDIDEIIRQQSASSPGIGGSSSYTSLEDIDSLISSMAPIGQPQERNQFISPSAPPSPADALQRQVDATIAARETSQRYATLPKPIADVYNVYKDENLAREARDLADQLKREYPEYSDDIEDLLMKGLRPEDIRTQITQKRERKRRQSELATQYPDFAKDVGKLFDQGFSADEVEAQVGAMARSAYEQRQAKEALQYGKIAERGISLPPAQPVKEEGPSIGQQAAGLGAEVAIGATSQAAGAALAPATWGISYPVLSFAGGFTGSLAAQEIEGRDTISYGRAIRDGLLNLIPAGKGVKAATVGGKIAKTAVRGAVAGAPIGAVGAVIETGIEEQRLPTFEEIASQAAGGAVSGAVIGGAFAGFGEAFKSAYSKFAGKTTKQLDDAYRAGDPDAKLVVDTMKKVSRDAPDDVSPTSVIDRAEDIEKKTSITERPAGVPEQTPEQRQYVLDQVLMEEAGRANIADYERMMETSRQETARRAEEAKRFQETVKAREAGKQADELLRRLEEARAKKPETEVTGEGPVTGVMPEDKYIGKQITAGMIGEREIGALYGRRDQLMKQLEKAKPGIDYDVIQSRLNELNRIIDENKPGATTDYSSADDLRSKLEEKIKGIESYTERRLALEDDARLHGVQFAGRTPEQIISDITRSVERERAIAAGEQIPVPRTEEKPAAPVEKPKQQRAASDIYRRSEPVQEPIVEAKPQEARSAFEIAMARGEEPLARKEDVSEVRPEQVAEPVAKPFNYGDTLEQLDINALREDIKILGYKGGRDRLVAVAEKFGLPTEGSTPKQILKKIEEAYNAAKERQVAEGGVGEYRGDGARVQEEGQDRIITPFIEKGRPEAGGGYRPAPGGNVPTGPVGRGVQGQQAVTPAAGGAVPPTTPPPAAGGAAGAAGAPAPAGRVYTRPAAVGEKISSIFGKIGENIKAQNVAARSLEENRQMGDAASNIGREAFSSIKYIQDKLSKTAGARQVEDDLSKIVENTGSVTVPAATITVGGKQVSFAGGTFSREDIKDMSYSELVEIAKAGGWYNSKMNSADDLKKLALQQTKSDMTVDDFVSKYNLSTDDAQLLKRPFDDAKDFAKTLGAEVEYTGLVDLGNYIASQGAYAQRKYLRNIAKGQFEPTPAARIEAEGVVEQAINRRIDQRSGRLAKIDSKGVNIASYMNTDDPKQAAQIISGLDLDTQRELVDMRDFYRKAMNQAVNVVEQTTPTGRTYTFDKKASDIKIMASHIVDQMVKPPDDALNSPTSGGGSAMDALMKRDLDQVFQRLFGRIKDPAVVMAASRETQASLIGRYQSIRKLAESSELFTDDPVLASQKKWVRLAGSQRSTDPITDNDRKRYGVLAGMHAPESVKALLTNEKYYAASFIPQTIRGVEDALNKVSSVTRGGKVIFAPKSSIRDALTTAVTSSLGSGDIPLNPKQWTKEVSDVYSILRKYAVAKAKGDQKGIAEAQRFFRYLAETGIYKPGSSSYWDDMANAINGEGKISTIWKNLAAGRSYLTDMPFKVAGYNVRYKEALKWGWSEQKAKAWALDNIRRHYDNRDAVPKAFRDVAAKSTSPDYLPFKYSIARARMLQAVDAFSRDLKNKDIPPEAKARIIYGFFASTATTPALAIGKYGNKILKYGAVLATAYKGTEMMSDNAETADEKVDNAVRYISPAFAQRDPMVTFVDDKDGKKRLVTFSLTGAFTANPLEEYALGGYQTAGDKRLSKSMIEKLAEYGVGGDVPMVPNMLYQFMAGEPIGAYYQREGFFDAGAKSVRALSNALKLTGDAREEQFSLSKQYGTDALIRLAELGTAPLGSVIQTPVKALGMEERKKALEREVTQERKEGRVPMGYGEEEGRPVSEYMPTRTIGDLLMQGVAPHNVRIMEESDVLFNLRDRADTLRRATTDLSKETAQARRELDTEERRKAKKPLLDSYFTDWKEQSEQLLSLFGSKDIRRDQADILAKAGLADWEIEYILGISPPTKSEPPGLKNLRGGLKTIK